MNSVWRPAGMVYLTAMLIGLAAGLWPGGVRGSVDPYWPSSVPAVQTLTVAQVGFYLLAYPMIVIFRSRPKPRGRFWTNTVVEMLFWAAVAGVFYIPAVWLSGSGPMDAFRGAGYILSLWPMVWACRAWLVRPGRGGAVVLLISLFAGIGLPWLWYVSAEFFPGLGWSDALWRLCPITQAWDVAAPGGRAGGLAPVWAVAVWPVIAGVMFAIRMIAGPGEQDTP